MKKINPYFLLVPLEPITGLADDDDSVAQYCGVDIEDEEQALRIIRDVIVPHTAALPGRIRSAIQSAYRYFLTDTTFQWNRVLDSVLPPFEAPEVPRRFFELLYEACFGTSDYELADLDKYVVSNDPNEVITLYEAEQRKANGSP